MRRMRLEPQASRSRVQGVDCLATHISTWINCNRYHFCYSALPCMHTTCTAPRVLTINFCAHRICEKISFMVLISLILELKRIQVSFIGARSNLLVLNSCVALVVTVVVRMFQTLEYVRGINLRNMLLTLHVALL